MFAVLFTVTFRLRLKIEVWILDDPVMNDLLMEQLVPAGWIKGSWSVFGFTVKEMKRMSGEEDGGGWRTSVMGLPPLSWSSWWPVAGWGRMHNEQ